MNIKNKCKIMNICKDVFVHIINFLNPTDMLVFSLINRNYSNYIWFSMMKYYYPQSLIPLSFGQSYIKEQLCTALYYKHVINNNLRINLEWRNLERIEIYIDFTLTRGNRRMLKDVPNMFIERKKILFELSPECDTVFKFMLKGRKYYTNKPKSDMRLYGFYKMNDDAYYYLIQYNKIWAETDDTSYYSDYDYDYKYCATSESWIRYNTKKYPPFKF